MVGVDSEMVIGGRSNGVDFSEQASQEKENQANADTKSSNSMEEKESNGRRSNEVDHARLPKEEEPSYFSEQASQERLMMSFSSSTDKEEKEEEKELIRRTSNKYNKALVASAVYTSISGEKSVCTSDVCKRARWLSSFLRSDPRWQIHKYFDEVATKGRPGRGSLFRKQVMAKKADVFTVWRPTSQESIRNMMRGAGTGKAMDVKGKSARAGNISSYVPFVQISTDEHKEKIQGSHLTDGGTVRVYYDFEGDRDAARGRLLVTKAGMLLKAKASAKIWRRIDGGLPVSEAEQELAVRNRRNNKDNLRLDTVEDFAPTFYGIDVSERLFWQGFVMEQDCSRHKGTEWFINRGSNVYNMNNNFKSTRKETEPDERRVVVYQKGLGGKAERVPNPMEPRTLLVAYEENGTVLPVVSDFDLFLLGSRGLDYRRRISEDHVELMQWLLRNIRQLFEEQKQSGEPIEWSETWPDVIRRSSMIDGYYPETPPYGHGDPVLYNIIEYAAERLKGNGCVRHGPECFNLHFPQDIDEEFLVVCEALPGNVRSAVPWKYMNVSELQEFLMDIIDDGFTFPINPKWVLCDPGWKRVWDKLVASDDPKVQRSLDCWFPPERNIREEIETISAEHPHGLNGGAGSIAGAACGKRQSISKWDASALLTKVRAASMMELTRNRSLKKAKEEKLELDRSALLNKVRAASMIVQTRNSLKKAREEELELRRQVKEKMQAAGMALNRKMHLKGSLEELELQANEEELELQRRVKQNIQGAKSSLLRKMRLKDSFEELKLQRETKETVRKNTMLLKRGVTQIIAKSKDSCVDLRRQILNCFDQAVQEISGQGSEKAEIFTVWIDKTPEEAIKRMMLGMGSGKGMDIKTTCVTRGNIKSHIPFILSCEEKHKEMLWNSLRDGQVFRVFYPSEESRSEATENLLMTKERMLYDMRLLNDAYSDPTEEDLFMGGRVCNGADLGVDLVDDLVPEAYGLYVCQRLLWEAYVMQGDCSRPQGSEWDVGIKSPVAYAQMNIDTLQKKEVFISAPKGTRPVLYQLKENSPMEPRTLVMAYEENGDVKPVVEGFDCFLFGTRGVQFEAVEKKERELLHWSVQNIEECLHKQKSTERSLNWIETWHESLQAKRGSLKPYLPIPQYGTSGPTSYKIFESAIEHLQDTASGCVRHAAECFNLILPKPLEDKFLVISDTLPGDTPWKHVNGKELQDLLCAKIDEGFTIPLNPKWILCDAEWKKVYDKLLESDNPDIQHSLKSWTSPESGITEDIDRIWNEYSCGSSLFKVEQSRYQRWKRSILVGALVLVAAVLLFSFVSKGQIDSLESSLPREVKIPLWKKIRLGKSESSLPREVKIPLWKKIRLGKLRKAKSGDKIHHLTQDL